MNYVKEISRGTEQLSKEEECQQGKELSRERRIDQEAAQHQPSLVCHLQDPVIKALQTSGFKVNLRDKIRLWDHAVSPGLGLDYLAPGKIPVGWVPAHTGALYCLT